MFFGLSRESQLPLAPEGGSAGSYGPAPSMHGLLGQGQRNPGIPSQECSVQHKL